MTVRPQPRDWTRADQRNARRRPGRHRPVPRRVTRSRSTILRDLRRVVADVADATGSTLVELAAGTADGPAAFGLTDGLAIVHVGDIADRLCLWCPSPPGVPAEMVSTEPNRFFRPDPATVDPRWAWLGTYLDGRDDDAPDWDEIAAIITDALNVIADASAPATSAAAAIETDPDAPLTFTTDLWLHPGGNWYFVTLPVEVGAALAAAGALLRRGFGSLKVNATIGATTWSTSVFPDANSGTFVLPVKKPVRRAEGIDAGDSATVTIELART